MDNKEYKEWLISQILEWQTQNIFTKEMLQKKTTKTLERIFDNIQ